MSNRSTMERSQLPLRLWPGVAIVAVQWIVRFGLPLVWPDGSMFAVIGGLLGFAGVIIWWLFFSRAAWFDRVAAIVVMFASLAATSPFLDVSLATGAMGMLFPMLAVPGLCLAFVLWAAVSRPWPIGLRRATMVVGDCGAVSGLDAGENRRIYGRVRQRSRVALDADAGRSRAGASRRHAAGAARRFLRATSTGVHANCVWGCQRDSGAG